MLTERDCMLVKRLKYLPPWNEGTNQVPVAWMHWKISADMECEYDTDQDKVVGYIINKIDNGEDDETESE